MHLDNVPKPFAQQQPGLALAVQGPLNGYSRLRKWTDEVARFKSPVLK